MAISLNKMVDDLAPRLRDFFDREYSTPSWAVFFTYDHNTMETHIHEVVPWDYDKHRPRAGLMKVYAKDEMDAYMNVMKNMKEQPGG